MFAMMALAVGLLQANSPIDAAGVCAAARVSAGDRTTIADLMRAGTAPDPALLARMQEHLTSCGVSAEHRPYGVVSAVSYVARDQFRTILGRGGINVAIVDRWFAAQSDAVKLSPAVTAEDGDRMAAELIKAGIPQARIAAQASLVGSYVAALILIERMRRGMHPTEG